MNAVPSKRAGIAAPPQPGGLTVVPRVRKPAGKRTRSHHKRSRFAVMFRSNPVRVTAGLLIVSAVVFGLVLLNIYVAQASFELSDLERRAAELQTEQRRLRYEVAKAESPERIVEMGTALGLVAPTSQEYLEGPSILVAGEAPDETLHEEGTASR
jgi:cell division protein FtsL